MPTLARRGSTFYLYLVTFLLKFIESFRAPEWLSRVSL